MYASPPAPPSNLEPQFHGSSSHATLLALQTDISDTNVEQIGSEEDKVVRKQAAQTEEAWAGCGKAPGIEIWRVESFKIKPWPKEMYGSFYEGDSYVVLHTYKESADSPKLAYDVK